MKHLGCVTGPQVSNETEANSDNSKVKHGSTSIEHVEHVEHAIKLEMD